MFKWRQPLTSCAVFSECFKEVKGRCGPVLHWEKLADPAGRWSVDTSHLAIQSCLKMTALPPQQGRNVSVEKEEYQITQQPFKIHPEDAFGTVLAKIINTQTRTNTTPNLRR